MNLLKDRLPKFEKWKVTYPSYKGTPTTRTNTPLYYVQRGNQVFLKTLDDIYIIEVNSKAKEDINAND